MDFNKLAKKKHMDFNKLAKQYKDELLENVLPFWINNSQDKEYGGYFSCLNRDGSVFDTDKFIWLQGREVWLFAMLYNKVEKRQEWLDCAIQGAEFLKKYGITGTSRSTVLAVRSWSLTTSSLTRLPPWRSANWHWRRVTKNMPT